MHVAKNERCKRREEYRIMNYLEEYGVSREQIEQLRETLNEEIVKFITLNETFVRKKLDYLKDGGFIIYPIIEYNIRIKLETPDPLKKKIKKMETLKYSKKQIQIILMDEKLYSKI